MIALYAQRKGWEIGDVTVDVDYDNESEPRRFDVTVHLCDGLSADQVARLGRTVSAPASVRSSGVEPEVRFGSLDDVDDLLRAARDSVGAAGTVVAIVPEAAARPDDDSVLTATETKGLEFDGVVVFDPAAIAAESPLGTTRLYVALTRTTRLLWVVEPPRCG